jgi:UDP-N-acetylglucosamine 4-epimerase
MIEEKLIQRTQGLEKKEPIYRDFRAGDVRHSQADISKAQLLLGYKPKQTISQGLDIYMHWFIKNNV